MAQTVELIAKNIKRLREIKHLSQKEVCADSVFRNDNTAVLRMERWNPLFLHLKNWLPS